MIPKEIIENTSYPSPNSKTKTIVRKRKRASLSEVLTIKTDVFTNRIESFLFNYNPIHDRFAYIMIGIAASYFFGRFLVSILFNV